MVWPTDRTQTLNDISSTTFEEVIRVITDLITTGDDTFLQVLASKGCINPYRGGDRYSVDVQISTGETEIEYDPAAANPTTTVNLTGYQDLAPATYHYAARTKNVTVNQSLPDLNTEAGRRKIFDILTRKYRGNAAGIFENMQSQSSTLGFWNATGKLPTAGQFTNAKSLFADQTSDFAGVDVSTYDKFLPQLFTGATADGSTLIDTDLQEFFMAADFAEEGGITDVFTNQSSVFAKISSFFRTDAIMAIPDVNRDLGHGRRINFRGVDIHGLKTITTKNTAWDVTTATTAEWPFVGIDTTNFELRYRVGQSQGDDGINSPLYSDQIPPLIALITDMWLPDPTTPRLFQRMVLTGQYGFSKEGGSGSRRTSGHMENLTIT